MFSKKVTAILLVVGVVASTCALFNEVNIKGVFADTVKQNVVYSNEDTQAASQDDGTGNVTGADKEAYRQKSLDILKNYFNISVEENENNQFTACILNEKTLNEIKQKEKELIQEEYDNKEMPKEEYDRRMAYSEENNNGLIERVKGLKHGMVQAGWTDINNDKMYLFDFNENTKEIDDVMVFEGYSDKSRVKLTVSEEQLKNTVEDFIKEHKLGDIENPKCILAKKYSAFYQEENDPSKKVKVLVNPFTGKVDGFSVKAYADYEYGRTLDAK